MSDRESVGTISGLVDEARRDGAATQLARLAKQKKLGTFGAAIILVMILMELIPRHGHPSPRRHRRPSHPRT